MEKMQVLSEQMRTKPRPNCILCGKSGAVEYDGLVDPFFGAPGVWSFKKCIDDNCGLMWLDPAPVEEDLHLAYKRYFTHAGADKLQNTSKRLRNLLYACYQAGVQIPGLLTGLKAQSGSCATCFY
jgi:hypothetical protein